MINKWRAVSKKKYFFPFNCLNVFLFVQILYESLQFDSFGSFSKLYRYNEIFSMETRSQSCIVIFTEHWRCSYQSLNSERISYQAKLSKLRLIHIAIVYLLCFQFTNFQSSEKQWILIFCTNPFVANYEQIFCLGGHCQNFKQPNRRNFCTKIFHE